MQSYIPTLKPPKSIIVGTSILYGTICLSFFNSIISEWMNTTEGDLHIQHAVIGFATLVVIFFLTRQISLRRKWARTVFLILFMIGIVIFPAGLNAIFKTNIFVGIIASVQALLQTIALIFLFLKESNSWFNFDSATEIKQ